MALEPGGEMAARRLSVRKIREVLRLGAEGLSDREIRRSLNIGKDTVRRYRARPETRGSCGHSRQR
jgi:DNA-binding NarL/FixJ family response regulator